MPPKTKIDKEMLLQAGLDIVRISGIDSVNSRNIAKALSCSTQPIFSHFPTMEQLRQEVHNYACRKFETEVLSENDVCHFMRQSYLKVINLARNEKNIFNLIYLSEYCLGKDFLSIRMTYESNQKIFAEIKDRYQLKDEACFDLLQRISIMIQGIATLIATTNIRYTDEQVICIVERTISDMVLGILKKEGEQ